MSIIVKEPEKKAKPSIYAYTWNTELDGSFTLRVEQLASEMSYRLGETMAQLVAATNPGSIVAMHQYEDFASMTSLVTGEHYDSSIAAQREANEAMGRRQKAMEDAARAAAAAFDAGIEAENNPVKLDSDRKLKAI